VFHTSSQSKGSVQVKHETRFASKAKSALLVTLVVLATCGSALVLGTQRSYADSTAPPPWDTFSPTDGATYGSNTSPAGYGSVGGLLFYNSLGQQITGGSTTSSPFAAYVRGATSTGGVKAQLYFALPAASDPSGWTTFTLGNAATFFPNASAPSNLSSGSQPVFTGASTEQTLSAFAAENPDGGNPDAGYYQIQMFTSGSGANGTVENAADILIDTTNNTWTLAYSYNQFTGGTASTPSPVGTATVLSSATSSPVSVGQAVDLKATVTDNDGSSPDGGTVQFYEKVGSGTVTAIGSPVTVSGGTATFDYTTVSGDAGSDNYTAIFTPNAGTNYSVSDSNSLPFTVNGGGATVPGAPTSPSATLGKKSIAVKWTDPASNGGSPITGYDVYCSTSSSPSTSGTPSATVSGATATSATVTGTSKKSTYYCVVTAANAQGQSAASPVASTKGLDKTKTTVACAPKKVATGVKATCTAKVSDSTTKSATASGTVAWSGGTGSFGNPSCTLSAGSCSVSFTPSAKGTQTITATFSGNGTQATSKGTGKLKVT
jgi:fibronectin type III domain protein/Big-like domain-containing protein